MRVDRLLGEHGLAGDTAEARHEFERRMETRRAQETDDAEWEPLRRGWCLGGTGFRQRGEECPAVCVIAEDGFAMVAAVQSRDNSRRDIALEVCAP